KEKMWNLVEDINQLDILKELGIFNAKTNSKGVVRDHIFSRNSGFILKVFPEILRHPCNCQILTHSANVKKKSSNNKYVDLDQISLFDLFLEIKNYEEIWFEQDITIKKIEEYKKGKRWTMKK
ncbi:unnamed protein product, partial [marine sediment metagenome]